MHGGEHPQRILNALHVQDRQFGSQASLVLKAATAERQRLQERIRGAEQENANLDRQITVQHKLITFTENDFWQVPRIALEGFITTVFRRRRAGADVCLAANNAEKAYRAGILRAKRARKE